MSKKIVIIDDAEDLLKIFELRFKAAGFEVLVAQDGQKGLELVKESQPSVVLTDHTLPGMTGLEIKKSLNSDESTKNIPVVLLTGHNDPEEKAKAEEIGISLYVVKPIDATDLIDKIQEILSSSA